MLRVCHPWLSSFHIGLSQQFVIAGRVNAAFKASVDTARAQSGGVVSPSILAQVRRNLADFITKVAVAGARLPALAVNNFAEDFFILYWSGERGLEVCQLPKEMKDSAKLMQPMAKDAMVDATTTTSSSTAKTT